MKKRRYSRFTNVIISVFTGIPVFLIKTLKNLILEIHVKMMWKLGVEVGMAERCDCGRFIYYKILSWLWEMHFLEIYECKNQQFPFHSNHGGACRWLYQVLFFLTYLSHMLVENCISNLPKVAGLVCGKG